MPVAEALLDRAQRAAALIQEHGDATWTVVHHIDADGVTSGGIAMEALTRAGIEAEPLAVKSLDDFHLEKIRAAKPAAIWFCDLGSTAYMHFDVPKVVCDHHELVRDGAEEFDGHVNPLLDDIPGHDVSGAGAAYLVADALGDNQDLLPMALVGASADLQDRDGRFKGSNASLLRQGERAGLLESTHDLAFYGPETRPLSKFFGLAKEYNVPGVTGSRRGAEQLLRDLGVPLLDGGRERTWSDLEEEERVRVRSAIVGRMLDCGFDVEAIDGLFRTVVRIPGEPHPQTRELQEFGTLLNATARYDEPAIGLAVARGDRDKAFQDALSLRDDHRKHLVGALGSLRRRGVKEQGSIQWVHVEDDVRDTVIGIVCGMALDGLDPTRPLIGLAWTPDGRTKISGRASQALQEKGLDLSKVMREAAAPLGGQGGGHKGAAGATIPRDAETAFVDALEACVAAQLGSVFDVPTNQLEV